MMKIVDKLASGCIINLTHNTKQWKIKMIDFVDNKIYYTNFVDQIIKKPVITSMTKSVKMWENLLSYIGVKIMLTKYDYYIFEREFDSIEKIQLKNIKSHIYFNNISGINVASTQL